VTATPPAPDGDRLGTAWRAEILRALTALAQAWTDPAAWQGITQVGGGHAARGDHALHGLRWAVSIAPEELQGGGRAVPAYASDLDVDAVLGHRDRGGTEHARRNQQLIIGPWTHMDYTGSFPNASSARPPAATRST
jgi:hypothetical protein